MNPYENCPATKSKNFTFKLIEKEDGDSLFQCYHDEKAVELMNDDNCDFGFYVETKEKMAETVGYWIDFYNKKYFIRFSIVDNSTGKAVGTVEGFDGEVGVLRIDLSTAYEKESYLTQILDFAEVNFNEFFGNKSLVTKAIPLATERCASLGKNGWQFIDKYRDYGDYYKIEIGQ